MNSSQLLKSLTFDSLLTIVPGLEKLILQSGKVVSFDEDKLLFKRGEHLSYLVIPLSTDINLIQNQETFFLLKGRSLALSAILNDTPIGYDVLVPAHCHVMMLEKNLFLDHLSNYAKIKHYLTLFTSSSSLRNFKRKLESLEVPLNDIYDLFSHIEVLDSLNGSEEDLKNDLKDQLIFISKGYLNVQLKGRSDQTQLKCHEGMWLGGEALFPPYQRSYTIVLAQELGGHHLPLETIRTFGLSKEVLQSLEEEPFLKLHQLNDDRYLNDESYTPLEQSDNVSLELFASTWLKAYPLVKINWGGFSTAKGKFDALALCAKYFLQLKKCEPHSQLIFSTLRKDIPRLSLSTVATIFESHVLLVNATTLEKAHLPCLMIVDSKFYLLTHEYEHFYYLYDPSSGFKKIARTLLMGKAGLECISGDTFKESTQESADLVKEQEYRATQKPVLESWLVAKSLFSRRTGLWKYIFLVSILIFLLGLIPPVLSQEIIDDVLPMMDSVTLITYGLGLVLCYGLIASLNYYRGKLTSEFSYLFDYDYSVHFYRLLLKLKTQFFGENRVGDVFAKLQELSQIRDFFSTETIQNLINFISSVIYVGILLYYSYKVALIPLAAIVILFGIQYVIRKLLMKKYLLLFSLDKKTNSQLSEMINSIATVKASNSERILLGNYEKDFLSKVITRRDVQILSSVLNISIGLFSHLVKVTSVWVSVILIFKKELSYGELFSINMFVGKLLTPLNALVQFVTNYEELQVSLKKLNDVFAEKSENTHAGFSPSLSGRITLDRISYRYTDSDSDVLKEISMTIFPKQVVALVGESGCGKTTLANLMAGNISPTKGKIFFDHVDAKDINSSILRSQIGFIQQNNELFAGTIESNATYNYSYVDEIKLNSCFTEAHCHEFIEKFPTGSKQYLAEGGMGLSGGQKQRLCIARTLYQNPKILIMDEATSALDSESEALLMDNLKKLAANRTTILIAHRLSTIRYADHILVIDQGELVEAGHHEELVAKKGVYYQLFKEQMR